MKGQQFMRFVATGVLSTAVDAGLHYGVWFGLGLVRMVPPATTGVAFGLLKAVTYASGMIVGFYANRRWTFQTTGSACTQAVRFAIVSLAALSVNALVAGAVNDAMGGGRTGWLAGILIGTATATLVSYTGHRRWTFATPSA